MPAVIKTLAGYAGGSKHNPDYYNLGDHTEVIQIEYDDSLISYRELVNIFWHLHQPAKRVWSRQYANILFYADEHEKKIAKHSLVEQEILNGKVFTDIMRLESFWQAENWHQKYYLRNDVVLAQQVLRIFATDDEFINATLSARLNGYLAGYGNQNQLEQDLLKYSIIEQALLNDEAIMHLQNRCGANDIL